MHHDAETVRRRIDALLERCRDQGLHLTPQRLAVYRALLDAEDHPTPEALYRKIKRSLPSLSLATVYKSLDALVALGVAREVTRLGDSRRYDANLDAHHHLVCTRCDKVVDYYDARLDGIAPPRRIEGFVAHGLAIQVVGLCAACARAVKTET